MGKIREVIDSITQALDDYVKNTDEAKSRRDAHKALTTETEWPTVGKERETRKKTKEPTGSSFGIYE